MLGRMSCALFFDRRHRVLLARFGRAVTPESLAELQERVRRFAAAHGPCRGILDFGAVEELRIQSHHIAALGRQPAVMSGQKRVFIAPRDEVFGLARMFGLHQASTGDEPLVVRSAADAYAALGLEAPDFVAVEADPPAEPRRDPGAAKPQ
jgi:hypothetical protein